jgi:hypothetical protein
VKSGRCRHESQRMAVHRSPTLQGFGRFRRAFAGAANTGRFPAAGQTRLAVKAARTREIREERHCLRKADLERTRHLCGLRDCLGEKNIPSPPLKIPGIKATRSFGINKTVRKVRKLGRHQSQRKPTPRTTINHLPSWDCGENSNETVSGVKATESQKTRAERRDTRRAGCRAASAACHVSFDVSGAPANLREV